MTRPCDGRTLGPRGRAVLGLSATAALVAVLATAAGGSVSTAGALRQNGDKIALSGVVGAARVGQSVAVSRDGTTALVGAPDDDGGKGAVWALVWSGSTWVAQGEKLRPNDGTGASRFGTSVSLSADGATAVVGGWGDDGSRGAMWLFRRTGPGSSWQQEGTKLPPAGGVGQSLFGSSVALSGDATTAIVGGPGDANGVGAAWVYLLAGSLTKLTPSASCVAPCVFGRSVAASNDGRTLLVGAASGSVSTPGCEFPCYIGAVFSYIRGPVGGWTPFSAFGGTGAQDLGHAVALSPDGMTAIVGGPTDANLGAAWIYARSDTLWAQQAKLAPTDANVGNVTKHVGEAVALSDDAGVAVIGGPGVNGGRGAVWLFVRSGQAWVQQGPRQEAGGEVGAGAFGSSAGLVGDGNSALVGGPFDTTGVGAVWSFVSRPQVTAISPASGPIAGGTQVTIAGDDFRRAAGVRFGPTPATSFTIVSTTEIRAVAPPGPAGTVDITVRNSGGTSVTGAGSKFTYAGPAPPPPPPPPPTPSPPDTTPPTRPTMLRGRFVGTTLRLTWRAAKDDVALASQTVSRDGRQIRKVGPKVTRLDLPRFRTLRRTVFTVRGLDAAGNRSAPSNSVVVRPRKGGGYLVTHSRG